jgi:hypothetical protein
MVALKEQGLYFLYGKGNKNNQSGKGFFCTPQNSIGS